MNVFGSAPVLSTFPRKIRGSRDAYQNSGAIGRRAKGRHHVVCIMYKLYIMMYSMVGDGSRMFSIANVYVLFVDLMFCWMMFTLPLCIQGVIGELLGVTINRTSSRGRSDAVNVAELLTFVFVLIGPQCCRCSATYLFESAFGDSV